MEKVKRRWLKTNRIYRIRREEMRRIFLQADSSIPKKPSLFDTPKEKKNVRYKNDK